MFGWIAMETAPTYAYSASPADLTNPGIPGATVIGSHLRAFGGPNRSTRERLLTLLRMVYPVTGDRVHAGALAGAAARAATEYQGAEDIARRAGLEDVLSKPDGPWAVKELAIWQQVRSILPGSLSIWRIILGGIVREDTNAIPDIDALCKVTIDRRDKADWGFALTDPAHAIEEDAFSAISMLWPVARSILDGDIRKGTAPFEVASAAQILLTKSKTAVALNVGASLVMQAAVMAATDEGVAHQVVETSPLPEWLTTREAGPAEIRVA